MEPPGGGPRSGGHFDTSGTALGLTLTMRPVFPRPRMVMPILLVVYQEMATVPPSPGTVARRTRNRGLPT